MSTVSIFKPLQTSLVLRSNIFMHNKNNTDFKKWRRSGRIPILKNEGKVGVCRWKNKGNFWDSNFFWTWQKNWWKNKGNWRKILSDWQNDRYLDDFFKVYFQKVPTLKRKIEKRRGDVKNNWQKMRSCVIKWKCFLHFPFLLYRLRLMLTSFVEYPMNNFRSTRSSLKGEFILCAGCLETVRLIIC